MIQKCSQQGRLHTFRKHPLRRRSGLTVALVYAVQRCDINVGSSTRPWLALSNTRGYSSFRRMRRISARASVLGTPVISSSCGRK